MVEYVKVVVLEDTFHAKIGGNFDERGNLIQETEK